MAATLIIEGAAGLMKVAAHLAEAEAGLKREVRVALKEACKPVVGNIKEAMMAEELPAQWTGGGSSGASGGGSSQRVKHQLGRRHKAPSEKSLRRIESTASLRQTIAAGVGVGVGLNPNAPFVKIKVSSAKLPPDQKGIPKAIEKGRWRHPVYGNTKAWVQQRGTPYFYSTIQKAIPEIEAKVAAVATEFIQHTAGRPVV